MTDYHEFIFEVLFNALSKTVIVRAEASILMGKKHSEIREKNGVSDFFRSSAEPFR